MLPIFERYEKIFQSEATVVHVMHDEMTSILQEMLTFFIQPVHVRSLQSIEKIVDFDFTDRKLQLEDKEMFIGTAANNSTANLKKSERSYFFLDVRNFYQVACKKLVHYLPLQNVILKDLKCLKPGNHTQSDVKVPCRKCVF